MSYFVRSEKSVLEALVKYGGVSLPAGMVQFSTKQDAEAALAQLGLRPANKESSSGSKLWRNKSTGQRALGFE